MEILKAPKDYDADSLTQLSFDSDYRTWGAYYGSEEYLGEEEQWEEVADEEVEEETMDDVDIMADLMSKYQDKRAAMLAETAEEKKDQLKKLIGLKDDDDLSRDTIITPELSGISVKSLSESSTHPCLVDIDISDSQLKLQNLYTMFPVPDDPGIIPAFWNFQEIQETYDDNGVNKFFHLTKKLKLQPIKSMKKMLLTDAINLQYYGVNSRIIKPLCEALKNNIFVQTIDLTGNWLSDDSCYHLSDLLEHNNNVTSLLLSGCRIGPEGAAKLEKGISQNKTLITLDVTSNDIQKEGLECIVQGICENSKLRNLSLNDNHLDESCVDALCDLITGSKSLKKLELVWNSLYTVETWRKLAKGLEMNEHLVDLDLSWNALGKECIPYLRNMLMRNRSLAKLNLSGNRFYSADTVGIARSLAKNQTLREVYLGNNPLKGDGVYSLVRTLTPDRSPECRLRLLDLTNVWANKNILPELETIKNDRPWLDIKLGGILSNYEVDGPDVAMILFKRANYEAMKPKNKRRRRNFGHFILSLSDNPISKGKFTELVKQFGLRLSQSLVNEITKAFISLKNAVDQELMKAVYLKQYPNTKLPPEKPPKKAKGKGSKKKKKTTTATKKAVATKKTTAKKKKITAKKRNL